MPRLPLDVVETLELAGRHPEGGAALLEGNLESIAALYQLHPAKVEHVRAWVSQPGTRTHVEEILASARAEAPAFPSQPKPAMDARALIARAAAMPDGLEFLTRAPIENAAVLLGSHPFVVEQARQHLAAAQSR